jgi:sugar phosphate isomerase/epimerase
MRFAVSNIAWSPGERRTAYARLKAAGFDGLEIAPGLLFAESADPLAPTTAEVEAARSEIAVAGLTLVSMQSLLYGVEGADLFGDADGRAAFLTGLDRAVALAGRLGIPNLVLGSPKQRNRPEGLDAGAAMDRAADFLRPVADAAHAVGSVIAVECNPAAYGTNFLTTPDETLAFVHRADHPAITLNFDLGAAHMTGCFDRIEALLEAAGPSISHVHVSEPLLAPAPADPAAAARVLRTLGAMGYAGAVSIEMRPPENGLSGLEAALERLRAARAAAGAP